jgi:RNA polymerase sigma-70 factor, ECF subfamily
MQAAVPAAQPEVVMPAALAHASSSIAVALVSHIPELQRAARQVVAGPDADDLVQDTLERAWRHGDSFRPGTNFLAWLRRIMSNLVVDTWRQQSCRRTCALLEEPAAPAPDGPPRADWEEVEAADLEAAVASLPGPFRAVYELKAAGLSYAQAARRLELPVGTVGTRLMRARRRLRKLLREAVARRRQAAIEATEGAPPALPPPQETAAPLSVALARARPLRRAPGRQLPQAAVAATGSGG